MASSGWETSSNAGVSKKRFSAAMMQKRKSASSAKLSLQLVGREMVYFEDTCFFAVRFTSWNWGRKVDARGGRGGSFMSTSALVEAHEKSVTPQ